MIVHQAVLADVAAMTAIHAQIIAIEGRYHIWCAS